MIRSFMRGFENTLADLYLEQEKSEELADRIVDFHIRVVENVWKRFEGRVDGFAFSDDWGTETGLFINPRIKIAEKCVFPCKRGDNIPVSLFMDSFFRLIIRFHAHSFPHKKRNRLSYR